VTRSALIVDDAPTAAAGQLALSLAYGPRYVVLYSGGHSSALAAVEVVRRYGTAGVVLLNHDLHPRAEDGDVKRFKAEVAAKLGLQITYASHDRWDEVDQFDVVEEAGAFKGANGHVLCTHHLKTKPFGRWLAANSPPGTATLVYGFDASESDRIRRRASILAAQGYETAFPLAHWRRTIQSTREIGVEPPLTYGRFKHANCAGCLKAGRQHWFVVYATRPDVWERAKLSEDRIGHTIINGVSLAELEPVFASMIRAGVEPTERVPQQAFWADAKRRVHLLTVPEEEEKDVRPCECVL